MREDPNSLWSVRDLARFYDFHERTIRGWIANGLLPCERYGVAVRVRLGVFLNFLHSR